MSLGACSLLMAQSASPSKLIASFVYSFGLVFLFGISALYHRPHWDERCRALLKRVDHAAIFILIAATSTPVCLLGLPEVEAFYLLKVVWLSALAGVVQSIFWVRAPKWFTALLYLAVGWLLFPYIHDFKISLGLNNVFLIVAGGVTYSIGALIYALKRPQLRPRVFGYHEFFHALTILGAGLHFVAIYHLVDF